MALLLLVWIYFYSLEHEAEESRIQNVVAAMLSAAAAAAGSSGDDAADTGAEIPVLIKDAPSEF